MRRYVTALALAGAVVLAGCSEDGQAPVSPDVGELQVQSKAAKKGEGTPFTTDPALEQEIESRLTEVVREVEARIDARRAGAGVAVAGDVTTAPLGYYWMGRLQGRTVGSEVIFEDRGNKRLAPQWVPGDARRNGRDDIGYAVAGVVGAPAPSGLTAAQVDAAVDRGMETWDAQKCSNGLDVPEGTLGDWLAFESDILHAGFLPLGPGVLGVTIPMVFVDGGTGEPTDVDSDGHPDYASALIVYNSQFDWAIGDDIDVETVALHEGGHGLAQAHFGKAFLTPANGELHFAPRAVMNAAYSGVQQSLTGTDRGGHCSMYGSWPQN